MKYIRYLACFYVSLIQGVIEMKKYSFNVEKKIKRFYENLSEKDKRHYAAIEALKLGHGGISYLADILGCARQTISKGIYELETNTLVSNDRVRRPGGGRKPHTTQYPSINKSFLKCN